MIFFSYKVRDSEGSHGEVLGGGLALLGAGGSGLNALVDRLEANLVGRTHNGSEETLE